MSQQSFLLSVAKEFADSHGFKDVSFHKKGAFKETFRATDHSGQVLALKLLDPSKCNPSRSDREIAALKKCNSPLIGKLYDYGEFVSLSGVKYYFSEEEFLDGGTLSDQIVNLTLIPDQVKGYGIALTEALSHLKGLKLVHRDIKPDNIMFRKNEPSPVLVDFGLVRDLSESSLTQTWLPHGPGTPYYAAPEQLNNDKHLIGWRTDQFSLGIVLGICLTGHHPFALPGMTAPETVAAVALRSQCPSQSRLEFQASGLQGIAKMLEPWPVRRYVTPAELSAIFN